MKDSRFDVRSKAQFIRDIKHSTMVEQYIFNRWAAVAHLTSPIQVVEHRTNGCDNSGEYLPTGTNTSGADFVATIATPAGLLVDEPLEVKLAPLHDFLTLKAHDLAAYARENASILFVMPALPSVDLRMSNGASLEERTAMLEGARLEWGIMWSPVVHLVASMRMEPQKCFGGKPGVRLTRDRYPGFFRLSPLKKQPLDSPPGNG